MRCRKLYRATRWRRWAVIKSTARILLCGLLLLLVIVIALSLWINSAAQRPMAINAPQLLSVERGSHLAGVLTVIEARGWIDGTFAARVYARVKKLEGIHPGDYSLQPGISVAALLSQLAAGNSLLERITLPEGWNVEQWQSALRQRGLLSPQQSLNDSDFLALLPEIESLQQTTSLEGWLFPDTYHYRAADGKKIISLAIEQMRRELMQAWQQRQPGLPYNNPYDLLIIASIIERETGLASEREKIAGVFVRRLKKGMRLQTDPTVIYGLGATFDGNLRRADLKQLTPYNTYMIDGLPLTPIANPGRASLLAAANPLEGEWLYFVGKGDGSHQFSVTLAEHQAAVRRYQRFRRAEQYRSAPPPR